MNVPKTFVLLTLSLIISGCISSREKYGIAMDAILHGYDNADFTKVKEIGRKSGKYIFMVTSDLLPGDSSFTGKSYVYGVRYGLSEEQTGNKNKRRKVNIFINEKNDLYYVVYVLNSDTQKGNSNGAPPIDR